MYANIKNFFDNCDPTKPLNYGNTEDKSYYIDFTRNVESRNKTLHLRT